MTCNWSSGYVSDVEYLPGLYVEQAPGHVILTCLLNGIAPPRVGPDFTYCELGCGQGVTALVIAAANPGIQVVATDFNPAHIARARDAAASAGIDNITFLELSFADMASGEGLPDFDMVTMHGVWSWIGAADRAHITAFLARRLKPGGAVSLSYNAMPGWTALLPMQRLLASQAGLMHGRSDERVLHALDFARRVQDAGSGVVGGPALLDQIRTGSGKVAAADRAVYLAHEYLNANWQPQYHMDTATLLAEAKLAFAGSAALMENFADLNLKPAQRTLLDEVPPGPYRETLKDYMVNRPFRRDVFVRGARRLSDRERDAQLASLGLVLTAVRSACRLTLDVPVGTAQLPARHYDPILDALATRPHTLGELASLPALKDDPAAPSLVEMAGILIGSGQALPAPSGLTPPAEHLRPPAQPGGGAGGGGTACGVGGDGVPADRLRHHSHHCRSAGVRCARSRRASRGDRDLCPHHAGPSGFEHASHARWKGDLRARGALGGGTGRGRLDAGESRAALGGDGALVSPAPAALLQRKIDRKILHGPCWHYSKGSPARGLRDRLPVWSS